VNRVLRTLAAGRAAALVCAAATLHLGGCSTLPRPEDDWTTGRLSVRVDADPAQAERSFAAAFELRGSDTHGELRLFTPLGTQLAAARWSTTEVVLATADGERRFPSLDEMALASLGERVPLVALPDWVAGRPWRGATSRVDAEGFEQLGWSVDLSRRADGRIAARREAPPAVTVRIQLDRPAS
jgi:outer membrane lipoprotein LolB